MAQRTDDFRGRPVQVRGSLLRGPAVNPLDLGEEDGLEPLRRLVRSLRQERLGPHPGLLQCRAVGQQGAHPLPVLADRVDHERSQDQDGALVDDAGRDPEPPSSLGHQAGG